MKSLKWIFLAAMAWLGCAQAAESDAPLRQKCLQGDARACAMVAYRLETDEDDWEGAFGFNLRGCDGGNRIACHNLANQFMNGKGVLRSQARAMDFYRKACSLGVREACYNLGVGYSNGWGVETDITRGAEFFRQSCLKGEGSACLNLGVLIDAGRVPGMTQNDASRWLRQGCELGETRACRQTRD